MGGLLWRVFSWLIEARFWAGILHEVVVVGGHSRNNTDSAFSVSKVGCLLACLLFGTGQERKSIIIDLVERIVLFADELPLKACSSSRH